MQNQSKNTNFDETTQVFGWRERRRRNCLTETTRTRRRRAALIKSKVALEIIISGHQELRSATDGRFQDLIVIGITTDLQIPRNLDDVCTSRDKPDKCFCLLGWIYKASHQPWPVKNLYDFGELRQ